MSWLTSTVWANRNMRLLHMHMLAALGAVGLATAVLAQEVRVPASVSAGDEATISAGGSGKATLYLMGPGVARKSEISLGEDVLLPVADLHNVGQYTALVCSDTCRRGSFYVTAAKPSSLTFLVHPSRVAVGQGDAISGVALPFDQFHNLVLEPVGVNVQLTAGTAPVMSRSLRANGGVAWFRTNSGKAAGMLQVVATLDDLSARRAVQQVASEPCNLRIKGQRTPKAILVETEPVRDCSGNPVPDGTIVTFTAAGGAGKSTVDAPIKQGVARAQMTAVGAAVVSAASGVVMGNELHVGAQP
jgi:hypothetical protein